MFGTPLGFVRERQNNRDHPHLGGAGYSAARKDGASDPRRQYPSGAAGAAAVAAAGTADAAVRVPNEMSVLARRCEFLEMQDKQRKQEFAEMRQAMQRLTQRLEQQQTQRLEQQQTQLQLHYVSAEVVRQAPTSADESGKRGAAGRPLQKGTSLTMVYPMQQDGGEVWMRRKVVDAHTAAIDFEWVLIFRKGGSQQQGNRGDDEVFVSNFGA